MFCLVLCMQSYQTHCGGILTAPQWAFITKPYIIFSDAIKLCCCWDGRVAGGRTSEGPTRGAVYHLSVSTTSGNSLLITTKDPIYRVLVTTQSIQSARFEPVSLFWAYLPTPQGANHNQISGWHTPGMSDIIKLGHYTWCLGIWFHWSKCSQGYFWFPLHGTHIFTVQAWGC